ncbi:MAG: hypothetical protein ISS28_03030 [Candidatus Cloacimonetes bacterium]|nr:hypothetical protein [Candidatus Cloacimonadota bacterium]
MGKILIPPNDGDLNFSGEVSKWSDFSADFKKLGTILKKSTDNIINITSIPSPWARMLLFRDAISTEHPLHSAAMSEILDVLEIIFFRRNFQIDFKTIPIIFEGNNRMLKGLNLYKPNEINQKLYILIGIDKDHKTTPIACTSPYTLFFVPLDKNLQESGRYFSEPKELKKRPKIFQEYIKFIMQSRNDIEKTPLKQFFLYLGKITDKIPAINYPNLDKVEKEEFITISGIKLYNLKKQYVESPLKLLTSKIDEPKPLIIYENMSGKEYYNGYKFKREIPDDRLIQMNRDILPDEIVSYPWLYPKVDFLEEKIYEVPYNINTEDIIVGVQVNNLIGKKAESKYLLPIKSELLKYFDVNRIMKDVILEESHGSVKITIKIPTENDELKIEKTYLQSDIVKIKEKDLIHFTLWPKVDSELWKDDYYLLVKALDIELYNITFFNKDGNDIRDDIQCYNKGESVEIYKIKEIPLGVKFSYKNNNDCIFIFKEKKLFNTKCDSNKQAIIATDFGTSNTTVAAKINNQIKILEFCNQNNRNDLLNYEDFLILYKPQEEKNKEENFIAYIDTLKMHFFPQSLCSGDRNIEKIPKNPFMSMIRIDEKNVTREVLAKGKIPFYLSEEVRTAGYTLKGDLKWSKDENLNYEAKMFLKEIFLLIKLYAVKNRIDLKNNLIMHWAYPKSFTNRQKTLLNNIWEGFCKDFKEHNSFDESIATLAYFAHDGKLNPLIERTYLTIDIGGGTSDVAIRHKTEDVFYFSTPFGGNDLLGWESKFKNSKSILVQFLVDSLSKNLDGIIEDLDRTYWKSLSDDHLRFNYLTLIMKNELFKEIITEAKNDKAKIQIMYFYGALFFELGIQISKIDKEKLSEDLEVYIGGNGLRFLYWLDGEWKDSKYEVPSVIKEYFKKMINAGMSKEYFKKIQITFSNNPKSEVAMGLCYTDEIKTTKVKSIYSISAGENVKYRNNNIKYYEPIAPISDDDRFDQTGIVLDREKSKLISFNNIFMEEIKMLNKSYIDLDIQDNNFYRNLLKKLSDVTQIEGYIRYQANVLFKKTNKINASLFVLGAKECIGIINDELSKMKK